MLWKASIRCEDSDDRAHKSISSLSLGDDLSGGADPFITSLAKLIISLIVVLVFVVIFAVYVVVSSDLSDPKVDYNAKLPVQSTPRPSMPQPSL